MKDLRLMSQIDDLPDEIKQLIYMYYHPSLPDDLKYDIINHRFPYKFTLTPENHQPSGCVNISRLTFTINLRIGDYFI